MSFGSAVATLYICIEIAGLVSDGIRQMAPLIFYFSTDELMGNVFSVAFRFVIMTRSHV